MKEKRGGINTGTSLVLVIFVVMCLVTFAVLSYVSAVSDNNLSLQAADRTKEYYDACNKAEERLELFRNNPEAAASFRRSTEEGEVITFTEESGENHFLRVTARVDEETGDYTIIEWTSNVKPLAERK